MNQSSGTACPYTVSKRYLHVESGLPLTVRYIGPLPPSSTANHDNSNNAITWIGVEWDDPGRGKHSGTYRDTQVFQTRVPGAASFLKFKPTKRHGQPATFTPLSSSQGERDLKALDPGIGLFQAIYQRYISSNDAIAGETPVDKIVLGSSNGHILVEMPNIEKVVQRLRRGLEPASEIQTSQSGGGTACFGIKEVGLEGEWVYGVEAKVDGLKTAEKYRSDMQQWKTLKGKFTNVTSLNLSRNLIPSWKELAAVCAELPNLQTLIVKRQDSDIPTQSSSDLARLETLDASNCSLNTWADVETLLRQLPSLQTLNLSGNPLTSIENPSSFIRPSALPPIHNLILKDTQVREWQSIDNLNIMFGSTLRAFNQVFTGRSDDRVFRIAKLGGLESLNGTTITKQERTDAERFYLTQAVKELGPHVEDVPAWGRLKELKARHGASDTVSVHSSAHVTLKSKMIAPDLGPEPFTINILPTAPLKLLKTKIARQLGVPMNSDFTLNVREAGNGEIREVEVNERANVASLELMDQDTLIVGIK
ncbi:hypothetical protein QFC21_002794 [Naganishia friedmannii]|uniref:Uncharacterized protein n=1 Tax=Naganishia friedmannii TaxID=89922 RepID=A0ACC2VTJ2_9TREE|nr:hypothetical protein QFC21_002794 [Naganishia friedmannii]